MGAKGVGVLWWKPNIDWSADWASRPPGLRWGEDGGNHKHLTLAEKRAARDES
jgi:hypothetical protein